jgi:hypothetical protein
MAELNTVKNGVMRAVSYFDDELIEYTRCGTTRMRKGGAVCIEDQWWVAIDDCEVVGWLDDGTPVMGENDCAVKNTTQLRKGK